MIHVKSNQLTRQQVPGFQGFGSPGLTTNGASLPDPEVETQSVRLGICRTKMSRLVTLPPLKTQTQTTPASSIGPWLVLSGLINSPLQVDPAKYSYVWCRILVARLLRQLASNCMSCRQVIWVLLAVIGKTKSKESNLTIADIKMIQNARYNRRARLSIESFLGASCFWRGGRCCRRITMKMYLKIQSDCFAMPQVVVSLNFALLAQYKKWRQRNWTS